MIKLSYYDQFFIMNNNNISIQDRSKLFAIRAIKAYTELNKRHFDDAGKVLAKQFKRASTSKECKPGTKGLPACRRICTVKS